MSKLLAVFNAVLVASYPVAVYYGLLHLRARSVGLLLLALLLPNLLLKWRAGRREDLLVVLRLPLSVMTVVGLAALLDDQRLVLALPVLINVVLLYNFASSLRSTPIVERFARMQDPQLGPAQVLYCRSVTKVWCAFFVLNALVSLLLALYATTKLWALYTGLIAYVLMGILGASEYVFRKYRFREYGPHLHDRLLAKLFPPASSETR